MKVLTMILAAGLALTPLTSAQTVKPEDRNAALKYATVFYMEPADLMKSAMDIDLRKVGLDKDKVPEDFAKAAKFIKENGGTTVADLIAASRLSRCDFEIPMEQGWNVLMPHLSKMRSAARMMRVDARRCLLEGDSAGAAERLVAIVGMARHTGNDHVLIASLVSAAIANVAADEAEMEGPALSADAKAKVAAALASMTHGDPFQMKAAVRGEQSLTTTWIRAKFQGPNAGREYARAMGEVEQKDSAPQTQASRALAVMNGQQLAAAVDLLVPYYTAALEVWDAPDSVEQLAKLGGRIEGGEFGPLGIVLAPALSKARGSELKAIGHIKDVAEKLGAK